MSIKDAELLKDGHNTEKTPDSMKKTPSSVELDKCPDPAGEVDAPNSSNLPSSQIDAQPKLELTPFVSFSSKNYTFKSGKCSWEILCKLPIVIITPNTRNNLILAIEYPGDRVRYIGSGSTGIYTATSSRYGI